MFHKLCRITRYTIVCVSDGSRKVGGSEFQVCSGTGETGTVKNAGSENARL